MDTLHSDRQPQGEAADVQGEVPTRDAWFPVQSGPTCWPSLPADGPAGGGEDGLLQEAPLLAPE